MRRLGRRKVARSVLLVGFLVFSLTQGMSTGYAVNELAWDLPALGGGRVTLASLRGSVVAASFGATWCPPCRVELPALQALADKYQGKNLKVFWVTIDDRKVSDQDLTQFVQKLGVKVPVIRDLDQDAFAQFGLGSVPFMVVIDKEGEMVGKPHIGFSDRASYMEKVSILIDSAL